MKDQVLSRQISDLPNTIIRQVMGQIAQDPTLSEVTIYEFIGTEEAHHGSSHPVVKVVNNWGDAWEMFEHPDNWRSFRYDYLVWNQIIVYHVDRMSGHTTVTYRTAESFRNSPCSE